MQVTHNHTCSVGTKSSRLRDAMCDGERCAVGTAGRSRRGAHLRGAYFVLQLHDELFYETTEDNLIQVGQR